MVQCSIAQQGSGALAPDAPSTQTNRITASETPFETFLRVYAAESDQQLICSIASVCRDWNQAVQQIKGGLNIHYEAKVSYCDMPKRLAPDFGQLEKDLGYFSWWLLKHAKLVSGVDVTPSFSKTLPAAEDFRNMVGMCLHSSIRAAAKQGLQLRSLCTTVLHNYKDLWHLSGSNLTRLELQGCDLAGLAPSLLQLQNLEVLSLGKMGSCFPSEADLDIAECLPTLNQLSKLTSLTISKVSPFDMRQLPMQLQRLKMNLKSNEQLYNLVHMSRLTCLEVDAYHLRNAQGSKLPGQLLKLRMIGCGCFWVVHPTQVAKAFQLTCLDRLERLHVENSIETATELLELAKFPRLRKLSLVWGDYVSPQSVKSSCVWPQIQQLQALDLGKSQQEVAEVRKVLGHIAASIGLTRLGFELCTWEQAQASIDFCQYISRLHKLQDLHVGLSSGLRHWSGHEQYLRPLTSLTKLRLDHDGWWGGPAGWELPDAAVIRTLQQLKQLRWLGVLYASMDVLQVIGSLRGLQYLEARDVPSEACCWEGLSLLCGLKNLTELKGFRGCSKDVLAQFWAVVRS